MATRTASMASAQPTLQSRLAAVALDGPVTVTFLPEEMRFSLRIGAANRAAAAEAFGNALPTSIGEMSAAGAGRRALCLGPDEWVLYAPESEGKAMADAFATRYADAPHSLVDISDREIALSLEGANVTTLLSVGCPADPRSIPVGEGRRTVFDGVTVVLHREAEERFRMEVWRSFLPHVWDLLNTANRELASGF